MHSSLLAIWHNLISFSLRITGLFVSLYDFGNYLRKQMRAFYSHQLNAFNDDVYEQLIVLVIAIAPSPASPSCEIFFDDFSPFFFLLFFIST